LSKIYRPFGFVMAANIEAIVVFLGAWKIGEWLNSSYPKSFNWLLITFLLGVVIVIISWARLFIKLSQFNKDDK